MKLLKDWGFWTACVIIVVIIYLSVATYLRWFNLNFFVGPLRLTHWFVWIGALFIAIYTPIYYVLKRRYQKRLLTLLQIHMFGNLFAFMLVSIHYAQQVGRPPLFFPDLGTGWTLYIVMLILVVSGFLHRFRIIGSIRPHLNRFLHVAVTMSFYIIIITHVLQGIGIL